jgi:hypothetical protein
LTQGGSVAARALQRRIHLLQERAEQAEVRGLLLRRVLQKSGEQMADQGLGHLLVDEGEQVLQRRGRGELLESYVMRLKLLAQIGQLIV